MDAFINLILQVVLDFVRIIPNLGLSFIGYVLNPSVIQSIFSSEKLYILWSFIRDLLNIFFVMILLLSAFATIFQLEKYNYKKILVRLIIAAFLVNFSYPLARILIDFSNILLYSLLNVIASALGYTGNFGADTITMFSNGSFAELMTPTAKEIDTTSRIFNIISWFLIGMSLLAMGFLLLVRIFALVILIIFSPIAFLGPAIPGGSKFSNMWWDNLLKYSFFAPIMLLFFYIALMFMEIMRKTQGELVKLTDKNSGTTSGTLLSSMIFSLIPPFIIWIGMGVAMKMGIAGADATMGRAKKFSKAFPGGLLRATPGVGLVSGLPGGMKQRWDRFKKGRTELQQKREAFFAGDRKKFAERKEKEKMEEYKKKGEKELKGMAAKGDRAAILRLTEDGKIDKDTYAAYKKATKHKKDDDLDRKVKVKNVDAIIKYQTSQGVPHATAYKNNLDDMDADTLLKQKDLLTDNDFHTHYLSTVARTDPKRIRKLAERTSQKVRDDWRARRYRI